MGRRRRKRARVRVVPKRKLPTIFECPSCGATAVSVSITRGREKMVRVVCSNCRLMGVYEYNPYLSPVDYFSRFLDDYEEGKLTQAMVNAHVEGGEEDGQS
uniref:Transcription elongation factor n=1 Tax=Thermofilum pendens TaxID=2269 RepID=A0A7C1TAF9_THEPE